MLCKDLSWIFLNVAESHCFKTTSRLEPKGKSTDPTEEIQVPEFTFVHFLKKFIIFLFLVREVFSFQSCSFSTLFYRLFSTFNFLPKLFFFKTFLFIFFNVKNSIRKFSWIFHHFFFDILNKTINLTMSLKLFLTFLSLMLITFIMRSVSILSRNFL